MNARTSSTSLFATALATPMLLAMSACTAETAPQEEPVTKASSNLVINTELRAAAMSSNVVINTQTDWSGTVTVTLHQCDWVGPGTGGAACLVADDELPVGGGIELEDLDGASMLRGSTPGVDPSTDKPIGWLGHMRQRGDTATPPPASRIRAYALGLKLAGISGPALRQMGNLKCVNNFQPQGLVDLSVTPTPGYKIVGGGAFADSGMFLTYSFGDQNGDIWVAGAKDHGVASPGILQVCVVQLPVCPPDYAGGCLQVRQTWDDGTWVDTGYAHEVHSPDTVGGYAMTSVGGEAEWFTAGRMLVDLHPFVFFGLRVKARSKDHWFEDPGTTWATSIGIRSIPQP
jgi:hypothetical protein